MTDTSITADITYTVDNGEKLINGTFGPGTAARLNTGTYERRPMSIRDGRAAAGLGLETSGFALLEHPTKVTDFFDPGQLETVYYPEVVELVKRESDAARVVVFDHTLRSGDETERDARRLRELVLSAHNRPASGGGSRKIESVRYQLPYPEAAAPGGAHGVAGASPGFQIGSVGRLQK